MLTDVVWTTMYGIKRVAYEGGLGLGDDFSHSLAAKKATLTDSRLQDTVKNAQNRWSNFGGDLLVYFESGDDVGYGHTDEDFSSSTQKLLAIDSLRASTKASPTIGTPVPATIDGNSWQTNSRGYGSNGTGSVSPFGTVADGYGTPAISSTSYLIRVPSTGTYSIKVNYSSNVATSLQIMAVGNVLGNATIGNNGGNAADTTTYSAMLNAGLQNIRLKAVSGSPNYTINSVIVSSGGGTTPTPTPAPSSSKYEAENASLSGGVKANTNHSGYSGSGFVDGIETVGATTTFTVNASAAGSTPVTIRYGNGQSTARTLSLYVNGSKIRQTSLPVTGGWDTWGDKVENLTLNSGTNTVAIKYDSGDSAALNLDYIQLAAIATPNGKKFETEAASLAGGAKINTDHTGYSGSGFVDGYWNGGTAATTITVNAVSAGAQTATLRYSNGGGGARTLSIYLNGNKIKQTTLAGTASWDVWADQNESLTLNAGSNSIAYKYDTTDSGNVNLDYVWLTGVN